jgi:hypothetical protein
MSAEAQDRMPPIPADKMTEAQKKAVEQHDRLARPAPIEHFQLHTRLHGYEPADATRDRARLLVPVTLVSDPSLEYSTD